MNARRGLLRIWIVFTALCFVISIAISYQNIRNEFEQLSSHDFPVECSLAHGKVKSDFYVLERGVQPVPDGFELEGPTDLFADLIPNNICWYHPEKFRTLYPEYNDLTDNDLRIKLYSKAKIEYPQPHPWRLISTTIVEAMVLPLVVLGLWFIGVWVWRGFKN